MLRNPAYRFDDFTNIVFIGYAPLIILANPKFPPGNPKELLAYAKSNPGKVTWRLRRQRFFFEHVQKGARKLASFQFLTQSRVVHDSGPSDVDHGSGALQ